MASSKLGTSALLVALLVLLGTCTVPATASSYLFWMPFTSKSMKITFMPVVEKLASLGHEVTVVMPYASKEKVKGVTEIVAESPFDQMLTKLSKEQLRGDATSIPPIMDMLDGAITSNDNALSHPDMQKYIKGNARFDVVVVSAFLANDAGYYLAHKFNAELCLYFTAQASMSHVNHAFGMPHNPSYLPLVLFQFGLPMKFWQRIVNTLGTGAFQYIMRNTIILGKVNNLLDKHFPGVDRPDLIELEKNASLGLAFGHPLLMDGLRPIAPNYINVGMMNCRAPKPLPADLQKFMDSGSEHGVVYVSFGSVLQASEMSEDRRQLLVNVFSKLKQKVIWKWETETMEGMPSNLKLSKWLPQQDILAHPNTKLFITHTGQSSFQETLCHKKPVVAIPVAGDQPANAGEAVRLGIGKAINFRELTEENLYEAITEVINDPSYTKKVQEYGNLLLDQETKPLDRAIWWLEYIVRNPGNPFRSPVHDLAWYEYFLLDVIAVFILLDLLLIYAMVKCCRCICGGSKKAAGSNEATRSVGQRKKRN